MTKRPRQTSSELSTLSSSECPCPAPRCAAYEFRAWKLNRPPKYTVNPWDSYEPFRILSSHLSLVLCNGQTEVRTMRIFKRAKTQAAVAFPLFAVPHPSFVELYEVYEYRGDLYTVFEYVGFSVEDLLHHWIYPQEHEIAYIVSRVLAGMCYIESAGHPYPRISTENILISQKGEVKIDQTHFPDNDEHTAADAKSLGTVMLSMMNETRESLGSTFQSWTADALDFVEQTSYLRPDQLYDHNFVRNLRGPATLAPLCVLTHLQIARPSRRP